MPGIGVAAASDLDNKTGLRRFLQHINRTVIVNVDNI